MAIFQPTEYTIKDLKKLKTYLVQAKRKVEGDSSLDSIATGRYKDDAIDPIDQLNASLNRIVNTLNTSYTDSERQKIQSQICKEYMNLLDISKSYPQQKLLTEKLELMKPKENNCICTNYITLNNMV